MVEDVLGMATASLLAGLQLQQLGVALTKIIGLQEKEQREPKPKIELAVILIFNVVGDFTFDGI